MANVDFSDLSELTTPAEADKFCITDDSESVSDKSKHITYETLYKAILAESYCHRAQFTYKDADEIYIGAARYYHEGTANQLVYWDSQLTYTFANLTADDWCFLYLDDSAIVTADTNLLTATEFIDSTTAPSWSASKHGWYSGNDRCIFAVHDDTIDEFHHSGELVLYASDILDVNESILHSSWETKTLTIPDFATQAYVTVHYARDGEANSLIYCRPNGSGGTGIIVARLHANSYYSINTCSLLTNSSQRLQLKDSAVATGNTFRIYTNGWYFPIGM